MYVKFEKAYLLLLIAPQLSKTPAARRANHWIGTAKLGTDSGLSGGSAVVDLNTQVYGTDNIHVVDASIFPGSVCIMFFDMLV